MTIKSERELAKRIDGLRAVVMSGAGDVKGDLIGDEFLIQEMSSERGITVTKKKLERNLYEARKEFRELIICLRLGKHTIWGFVE